MGLRSERAACRCCDDELTSWSPNPPTELAVGLARLATALRRTRGGDSPPGPKAPWVPRSPPLARRGFGRRGMLPAFGCNLAHLAANAPTLRTSCSFAWPVLGRKPCGPPGAARSNVPPWSGCAVSLVACSCRKELQRDSRSGSRRRIRRASTGSSIRRVSPSGRWASPGSAVPAEALMPPTWASFRRRRVPVGTGPVGGRPGSGPRFGTRPLAGASSSHMGAQSAPSAAGS
jgi:hypothetical protein